MVPIRDDPTILDVLFSGWGIAIGILIAICLITLFSMKRNKNGTEKGSYELKIMVFVIAFISLCVMPAGALGALRENQYYATVNDLEEAYGVSFSESNTQRNMFTGTSIIPSSNSYYVFENIANTDGTEIYDKIQIKRDDSRNLTILAPISEGSTQYAELELVN